MKTKRLLVLILVLILTLCSCQTQETGEGESVEQYVNACAKQAGSPITVKAFVRFICGEGIEKRVDDLAGEIASMLNK